MKLNGSRVRLSEQGGKLLLWKITVVPLIVALVLSAFATTGAFAAPPRQDDAPGSNDLEASWENKRSQLAAEAAFFNNFRTKPGQDNSNISQYIDKYAAALASAQSLLVNGGFDANGQVTSQNQAKQSVQQLQMYLSMMRGLRQKMMEARDSNSSGNNNNNAANNQGSGGVGIPVTGGNNASTDTSQNFNQNAGLAKIWGNQFTQLQAAASWYENFRTKPGQMKDTDQLATMQRYLDQYAFALRQANSIIVSASVNGNGQVTNNANGQASDGSDAQAVTQNWGSPQQQLGMYLGMMRQLREKIMNSDMNNNADTVDVDNAAQQTP